jgi:hypothetical protein
MAFPADDAFNIPVDPNDLTESDFAALMADFLTATRQLPGARAASQVTISGGVITPTRSSHTVETEGGASSDNLDRILPTNLPDGARLLLVPHNTSHQVTLRHAQGGVGELMLAGGANYTLTAGMKSIEFMRVGSQWWEINRVGEDLGGGSNYQLFTGNGTFTVPTGVTTVILTMCGGGGGGGGGAGTSDTDPNTAANGSNGTAGGGTSFGVLLSCAGGAGGLGGNKNGRSGPASSIWGFHGGDAYKIYGGRGAQRVRALPNNNWSGHGGAGGDGGSSLNVEAPGGGGSSGEPGQVRFRERVSVTPGASHAVTIGAAGTGGAGGAGTHQNGTAGSDGGAGIVLVEW